MSGVPASSIIDVGRDYTIVRYSLAVARFNEPQDFWGNRFFITRMDDDAAAPTIRFRGPADPEYALNRRFRMIERQFTRTYLSNAVGGGWMDVVYAWAPFDINPGDEPSAGMSLLTAGALQTLVPIVAATVPLPAVNRVNRKLLELHLPLGSLANVAIGDAAVTLLTGSIIVPGETRFYDASDTYVLWGISAAAGVGLRVLEHI